MGENELENGRGQNQVASADSALIHQVRDGGTQGVFSQGGSSENVQRLLGNVQMTNAVTDGTSQPRGDAPQQQQGNSRLVDGANGSKIQLEKFPDGQERPTIVQEPDGVKHRYRWQDAGGGKFMCTAIEDINANGQVEAQSMLNRDGSNWTIKLSTGQQFNVAGQLDVKQDGTHQFTESQTGNKFIRSSTGEAHYVSPAGQEIPGHPLARGPKGTPSEAPAQQRQADAVQVQQGGTERRPDTPPDRFVENENGSRIEYRKVGGKEVVSAVVHPSGSRTEYGNFDSSGNAQKIEEYDANGKKVLSSVRSNGNYWEIDGDGARNGNELIRQGVLKVTPDGTHEFKDANGNTTFTRKADGSVTFKNAQGGDITPPSGPEPIAESRRRARESSTNNETLDAVDWTEDSKGDEKPDADKFDSKTDGVYDPARPWGLAKQKPGQAGGDDGNLDWRKSKSYTDGNGNTTYKYEGELEDSYAFNAGGDTNFTASETYNKDGKLTGSKVEYADPVDQSFTGPNGQKVSVEDVKSVETTTAADGTLTTTIKDSSGKGYVVTRNGSGAVTNYRKI